MTTTQSSPIPGLVVLFVVGATFLWPVVEEWLGWGDRLEVSGHTEVTAGATGQSELRGLIRHGGRPIHGATVWATARGGSHEYGTENVTTDATGRFQIPAVPTLLGGRAVTEITVRATAQIGEADEVETLVGEQLLRVGTNISGRPKMITVSLGGWLVVGLLFVMSIVIALSTWKVKTRYFWAIGLAFAVTTGMILMLATELSEIEKKYERDVQLSLGVFSLVHGSYVEDIPAEWVLTFTSVDAPETELATAAPGPAGPNPQGSPSMAAATHLIESGFGAPLWVILLSVVGASLLTVSILIKEISDHPEWAKIGNFNNEIQQRIQKIVRHQFFMVFSPIGAVFVYQTMVGAEAANSHLTVAVAALGSGATLNVLLNYAVDKSVGLISTPGPMDMPDETVEVNQAQLAAAATAAVEQQIEDADQATAEVAEPSEKNPLKKPAKNGDAAPPAT